jgi:hypothetical protein
LGPKAFAADRLLAIFYNIVDERVDNGIDIYYQASFDINCFSFKVNFHSFVAIHPCFAALLKKSNRFTRSLHGSGNEMQV